MSALGSKADIASIAISNMILPSRRRRPSDRMRAAAVLLILQASQCALYAAVNAKVERLNNIAADFS
jgi:hypothetical protein